VTQQGRTPAGGHGFSEVVAAAWVPVGVAPAITIIMVTASSRAPARPTGQPSPVPGRAVYELAAFGREMGVTMWRSRTVQHLLEVHIDNCQALAS
jgi:hypothetical protein